MDSPISRRRLLRCAAAGGLGAALAGCGGRGKDAPPEASPTKEVRMPMPGQQEARLAPIPEGAEMIIAAQWETAVAADGPNDLYTIDSNGEKHTRLSWANALHNHFAVSPGRDLVAVNRWRTAGNAADVFTRTRSLHVYDLENGLEWPLLPDWDCGGGGIDWSPDGEYIYCAMRPLKSNMWDIDVWRIRPDGTGHENCTKGIEYQLGRTAYGKWVSDIGMAHDGEWIAGLYTDGTKKNRIFVCRTDGTEARLVTDGGPLPPGMQGVYPRGDYDPEFRPAGGQLVFQRVTDRALNWGVPSHDIMIVNVDGTGLRRLTAEENTGVKGIADWSADDRIVFSEWNQAEGYVGPVLVNADGSDYRRLEKASGGTNVRFIP